MPRLSDASNPSVSTSPAARPYWWATTALLALASVLGAQDDGVAEESARVGVGPGNAGFGHATDLFTGRLGYSVAIEVPAARLGGQPNLALAYGSGGSNGWMGVGWDVAAGWIQRDTRHGVPRSWSGPSALDQYDDARGFVFSLGGSSSNLIHVSGATYRAEVDQGFLRFDYYDNFGQPGWGQPRWVVTDKSGTRYTFGETAESRMENPGFLAGAGSSVFRWALSRVRDVHGNETEYHYQTLAGQLYLASVAYNAHRPVAGGAADVAPTHEVVFTLETANRPDPVISYQSGFRVTTQRRLAEVSVRGYGMSVPLRSYALAYSVSPSTGKSLLQSVTRHEHGGPGGAVDTALLPVTFEYTETAFSFQPPVTWGPLEGQASNNAQWRSVVARYLDGGHDVRTQVDLMDMDGDGLADRVWMDPGDPPQALLHVQRNTGAGFAPSFSWAPLDNQGSMDPDWSSLLLVTYDSDTCLGLWDITGDGLVDRVCKKLSGPSTTWSVQRNNGLGFDAAQDWGPILSQGSTNPDWDSPFGGGNQRVKAGLVDIDGDGLLDRVMSDLQGNTTHLLVQRNTGSGFEATLRYWAGVDDLGQSGWSSPFVTSSKCRVVALQDVNGDGLPDRVMRKPAAPYDSFTVQLNTGSGFAAAEPWAPVAADAPAQDWGWRSPSASIDLVGQDSVNTYALFTDINGDGLPDRVLRQFNADCTATKFRVQVNTGSGFGPLVDWTGVVSQQPCTIAWHDLVAQDDDDNDSFVELRDVNGDRLPDRVTRNLAAPFDAFQVQMNSGPVPDLLRRVENGFGGALSVAYRPSTQCDNRDSNWSSDPWAEGARSLLAFPVEVVASVSVDDGGFSSAVATTTYTYRGGLFDAARREFAGFHEVEVLDPLGRMTRTFFHQGGGIDDPDGGEYLDPGALAKRGVPYHTDTFGSDGKKYAESLSKVEETLLYPVGWRRATVTQTVTADYDPDDVQHVRATAVRMVYDATTGNLVQRTELGEISNVHMPDHLVDDVAGDTRSTFNEYALVSSNSDIVDRVGRQWVVAGEVPTLPAKRDTRYTYSTDGRANLLLVERWLGAETRWVGESFQYDAFGNRTVHQLPSGTVTTTDFDGIKTWPTVTHVQTASGSFDTAQFVSTYAGLLVSETDVKGVVTTRTYDDAHRLIEVGTQQAWNAPAAWRQRYEYFPNTLLVSKERTNDGVDLVNGHEVRTYHDGLGRVDEVWSETEIPLTSHAWRIRSYLYDLGGNVWRTVGPYFNGSSTQPLNTITEYDPIGRPARAFVSRTLAPSAGDPGSPLGVTTTTYADDSDPWATLVTDAEGRQKRSRRDAYGRLARVEELTPSGTLATVYRYNVLGELTRITDSAGNVTTMTYDTLGRKVGMTDPDMGAWSYRYDDGDRIVEQTDAVGQRLQTDYDELGRVVEWRALDVDGNPVDTADYQYDSITPPNFTAFKGLLYTVTDGEGHEDFRYDQLGRVLTRTRTLTKTGKSYMFTYTYDQADHVQEITYPENRLKVRFAYDTAGHLVRASQVDPNTGAETDLYQALSFDEREALGQEAFGSGATTTHTYYPDSRRLQRLLTTHAAHGTLQDFTYTYDRVGDVLGLVSALPGPSSETLTDVRYDALRRMTEYRLPSGATVGFQYDAIGNVLVNGEQGPGTYTYDRRHVHAVSLANGCQHTYDSNGNMVSRGHQRLVYDARNRLVTVSSAAGLVSFGYAHDGRRLWKESGGQTTAWVDDLYEERPDRALLHVFAGDRRICTFEQPLQLGSIQPVPWGLPGSQPPYYVHADHLGSTHIVTDSAGAPIERRGYEAFGGERFVVGPGSPLASLFTDQIFDLETGLYYFRARYYDPDLGRFVQPDTLVGAAENPQALNRYSYCTNNPLSFFDPSGHFSLRPYIGTLVGVGLTLAGQPYLGAIASSAIGTAVNHGDLRDFATGLAIGTVAGQLGGTVAGALATSADMNPAGIETSLLRGGLSGAFSGGANAWMNGENVGEGALRGAAGGMLVGAFTWSTRSVVTERFIRDSLRMTSPDPAEREAVLKAIRSSGQSPVGNRLMQGFLRTGTVLEVAPESGGGGPMVTPRGSNHMEFSGNFQGRFSALVAGEPWGPSSDDATVFTHELGHTAGGFSAGDPLNVSLTENLYRGWMGQPVRGDYSIQALGQWPNPVPTRSFWDIVETTW